MLVKQWTQNFSERDAHNILTTEKQRYIKSELQGKWRWPRWRRKIFDSHWHGYSPVGFFCRLYYFLTPGACKYFKTHVYLHDYITFLLVFVSLVFYGIGLFFGVDKMRRWTANRTTYNSYKSTYSFYSARQKKAKGGALKGLLKGGATKKHQ